MDLADKTLAELDELADELRARILRDPQYIRAELENVTWEIEKRHWRENLLPASMPNAHAEGNNGRSNRPTVTFLRTSSGLNLCSNVMDVRMKVTTPVHLVLALLFAVCVGPRLSAMAEMDSVRAPLNCEQVVDRLVHMNAERAQALRSYQGKRVYRLVYSGFPGVRSAEMIVDVTYQSPGTKEFVIQSETGSTLVIDRVFKKLLQSEKEALQPENLRPTALNKANYIFTLLAYEATPGEPVYVLSVEPRRKDKFLYSGKIWVDAEDFAVARIEAEPAKNPSFWTRNIRVEQLYVKVDDFWLPTRNHSLTSVRLGGRADLTIDYQDYRVTPTNLPAKISNAGLR